MVDVWAREEMEAVDLKDRRLNERLTEVLSQLGGHPTASIPAACGGYAETAAAYRLFDNQKVNFENVLQPHLEATRGRIVGQERVILPQDTTEIDLTRPERPVAGAGPLDGGARRGMFLHLLHAFTPDGTSLGTLHAAAWVRPDASSATESDASGRRKHTPIENKESYRWIEGFRHARAEAQRTPGTHFICVNDSEADIYELLAEAQDRPGNLDWIIRACQDRRLTDGAAGEGDEADSDGGVPCIREQLAREEVRFRQTIQVRGRQAKVACEDRARRQPRRSRSAEVEVRAAQVTLRPPWRPDRKLPEVTVNVVWVREVNPPEDDVPVDWLLLTSLPIESPEQVREVIECYCVRWMIEILFRTLKSGCRVEARRFEHVDRFLPCLAVYLIVTWRTLYVCRLARALPEISCEAVFEPAEWKAVFQVVRRQPPPPTPVSLSDMVKMVAQLGGYVNRQRPDPPGPQTVWLGLQRVHDIALCWQLFGPEARTE
jgi:hypothetical protein